MACVICCFCAASPSDLMAKYHVSPNCDEFSLVYCEEVNFWKKLEELSNQKCEQKSITDGFAYVSDVGFISCASSIDGILI